ncbi:MAG: ABC transporter substrate-binding protein [Paenibacillaceae bacterium]|jgi:iron complex transport system substrate-binding protein|nr:ABC transporter substrate-binding protein [Paenibacillaceae bacterium]
MRHKIKTIAVAIVMCLFLGACSQNSANKDISVLAQQTAPLEPAQLRTITDLGGNTVKIPAAADIQRIVVLSPPVMSFVVNAIPDTGTIAGINARAFTTSNVEIVKKVFPNWQSVDTSFVDSSFTINKESLLALNADIIFYYGNFQKKGLENIDIPCIDFFSKELNDPEAVSIAWDKQLRDILGQNSTSNLQNEWNTTNEKLTELLKREHKRKTALCIFSNTAGSIVVSGTDSTDSYAHSFFAKAGITNAAVDIEGTTEVSMEQIYKWNPDMIIVFHDSPAQSILDNSIEGQDWSLLDAWKNKEVYDVPRTTYSWITPCADSPLMPLWLVSKAYPDLLDESSMKTFVLDYYKRNYDITLFDADIDTILNLRKAAKK